MSLVTIMPSGKSVEAAEGMTLLAVLLAAGEPIQHNCDSKATCGSCHIYVQEGRKGVSKIGKDENAKLDEIVGVSSKSRLACQATVLGTEDIRIELLGFDSGF